MFFFRKKTARPASKPHQKVIIVGAGEVGFHIAKRLAMQDRNVVVIDVDAQRLSRITESMDVQTILGSGALPSVLKTAGLDGGAVFLAVTDKDEINLLACMFANIIAPESIRLARIRNQEYTRYPEAFGSGGMDIHMMVNPEEEVVRSIDRLLSLPGALDYAEFSRGLIRMVCYKVEQAAFVDQPLTRFRELVANDGIMVASILREDKLIIPKGADVLRAGDTVYFVYKAEAQRQLLRALGRSRGFFNTACVIGGGNIGRLLAKRFEDKGLDVKLIDINAERCSALAEELDSTLVLNGDATDKSLLIEENIGHMDVVAAVTGDEETNILSCLLAKSLGVANTVARVNKAAYLPLVELIGIDHSVSPRLSAVNSFLNFIRQGRVVASASVGDDAAEVVEAQLPEHSPLTNGPVRELNLPEGALLLAVVRGEEQFIPNGNSVLLPHDYVIFLANSQAMSKLEPLLAAM